MTHEAAGSELELTARRIIGALESLNVPFHVTGGLASSFYGQPRFTQDIDIVVLLDRQSARQCTNMLRKSFIVQEASVEEALRCQSLFQALDRETFVKVDLHVGERIPHELSRSVRQPLFEGLTVPLVSKEDAILSKLLWIKEGSGKSRDDVLGLLLDPEPVDMPLIESLAHQLGCDSILSEMLGEARRQRPG